MTKRQAGRRSNSEGSVGQRKDGLWEARITLPGGRRRSLYAKTKAEALKKMEEAKGKIADGLHLGPERLTVQGWLEQWLRDFAYSKRTGTAKRYGELCRIHIIPSVGQKRLSELGVSDVQRMIREALARGVSPRNSDGNPDSPQAVVFLTSIVDVTVGY